MPNYTGTELIQLTETTRSILIWGPPITGKTYSLWTLAKWLKAKNLGKLHLADLDFKCESLVLKLKKENLLDQLVVFRPRAKPKVALDVKTIQPSKEQFLEYQKWINSFYDLLDPKTGKFKEGSDVGAVITDSMTRLQDIVKEFVIATLGRDIGAPNTDARKDFGQIMAKTQEIINSVKSLPCINGFLAHQNLEKDELLGKILVTPKLIGKQFPYEVAKDFNCILYSVCEVSGNTKDFKWQVVPGNMVTSAGLTSRDDLPAMVPQDFGGIF